MKFSFKNINTFFLFFLPFFINAQQKMDTVFYDSFFIETDVKDSVKFYRIATKLDNNYKIEDYYISNKIQMIGHVTSLLEGSKTGYFQYFHENGNVSSEGNFEFNEREGVWKYYYENGKIWYQTFYYKGFKNGELKSFYKSGELKRKAKYKLDVLIKEKCFDSKIDNADYLPVIVDPMYVGGETMMGNFLAENVQYPRKAKNNNIEGRVVIRFLITKLGNIDSIEVLSKPQPLLDNEIIYVIKKMPLWIPGKADCEFRDEHFVLPIQFKLD